MYQMKKPKMGRRREIFDYSASSSSSEFEFTFSDQSPCKSSITLCPADDLFYKGQLLPLHLSTRLSMVRTLFLASSSSTSSSSDVTTAVSRHSTDSTSSVSGDLFLLPDCDISRPTSVTDQDKTQTRQNNKRISFSRISSFFRNEFTKTLSPGNVKIIGFDAAEVIKKYLKKVKPVKTGPSPSPPPSSPSSGKTSMAVPINRRKFSYSFSGNLRYPRKSSRPSSTRSSPSHSGILSGAELYGMCPTGRASEGMSYTDRSSTEELESAIQGAIAHCKNSMIQNKTAAAGSDYEN